MHSAASKAGILIHVFFNHSLGHPHYSKVPLCSFPRVCKVTAGEGNGNPHQYSCLESSMDRGAWQATVHEETHKESDTTEWLNMHTPFHLLFSHPVVSDSLWPHGLQHSKPPCPSPSPEVCPSLCSLSQWCCLAVSSSDALFSFCPRSFPASETFPMSHLFTLDEIYFLSLCLFPPEIRDSWVLSSLIRCVVKIVSWHMQES